MIILCIKLGLIVSKKIMHICYYPHSSKKKHQWGDRSKYIVEYASNTIKTVWPNG